MFTFEDKEFEKSIMDERYHIAVPVVVTQKENGSLELLIYSFCEKIAREFEARFSDSPFSDEAKAFLCEKLTPVMNEIRYETTNACDRISLTYQMTDAAKINPECFRGRAKRLDSLTEKDMENSETEIYAFEINPTDDLDRIFAVWGKRKEIAAFAAINDIAEDKGFYELNVECAEEYRGQGYGSECVAELAKYLLERGVPVEYVTL
ncbi:MAG: GNAT family N-acetyltransferase, partial [Ruminococcaceae bacterium]|nr:GNAT family N-acetyltransferase [Oscillospiraceae bacterium]